MAATIRVGDLVSYVATVGSNRYAVIRGRNKDSMPEYRHEPECDRHQYWGAWASSAKEALKEYKNSKAQVGWMPNHKLTVIRNVRVYNTRCGCYGAVSCKQHRDIEFRGGGDVHIW